MRLRVTLAILAVIGAAGLTMIWVPAASAASAETIATGYLCNINTGDVVVGCVQSRGIGVKADLYPYKGSPYLTNFTESETDGIWTFAQGSECLTAASASFVTLEPCGTEGDEWKPVGLNGFDEWEQYDGFVSGCLEGDESTTLGANDPLSITACSHDYAGEQWEFPV
jgi:hypothetical protein